MGLLPYKTLKKIQDKLKANASSVPTTLGRGTYGHLGLLLTATQYATILPTPFITSGNPGDFCVPPNATGPQIEAAKDFWKNLHLTFKRAKQPKRHSLPRLSMPLAPQT